MTLALESEFDYYLAHQDEFVEKYNGKVLVIKDDKIIGIYDDEGEAFIETQKDHKPGTFLIHRCGPGEENYSADFVTPRVRFSQYA
ncbi:MAG: hypothetical protein OEY59_05390 [Deltaproteobacteria bacterium]|nr:hypothetical protein [Deltaproteobacteria bacterium]